MLGRMAQQTQHSLKRALDQVGVPTVGRHILRWAQRPHLPLLVAHGTVPLGMSLIAIAALESR